MKSNEKDVLPELTPEELSRMEEEYEEEIAAQQSVPDGADEDDEFATQEEHDEFMAREIEFEQLEMLREGHFGNLEKTKNEKPTFPPFEYLVEGLLPAGEVHIIAGETGAGKSTWLFQFIDRWQHEMPFVFGDKERKAKWLPYVILVNDRSKNGMLRTMQRMGLNPKQFPIVSLLVPKKTKNGKDQDINALLDQRVDLAKMLAAFIKDNPGLKVIFVEGFQITQEGDSNSYTDSAALMRKLNIICQKFNVTIIATTHISKENAKNGMNSRTAILGSVSIPGMCETVIVLTKHQKANVKLTIHPRNESAVSQLLRWTSDGKLVETEEKDEESRFVQFLNTKDAGDVFVRSDFLVFYKKKFDVGEDTADNERREAEKDGLIEPYISDKGRKEAGRWKKKAVDWNS